MIFQIYLDRMKFIYFNTLVMYQWRGYVGGLSPKADHQKYPAGGYFFYVHQPFQRAFFLAILGPEQGLTWDGAGWASGYVFNK